MKRFFSVLIVLIILAVLGAAVAGLVVDNMTAQNIENELSSVELPMNTTIVATASRAGKLTSKNGPLEFYGGVLLQSSLPLAQINSHYNAAYKGDLDIKVISLDQAPGVFGNVFPSELRFGYHDSAPKGYYMVYAFAEGEDPFPMLDYRTYVSG